MAKGGLVGLDRGIKGHPGGPTRTFMKKEPSVRSSAVIPDTTSAPTSTTLSTLLPSRWHGDQRGVGEVPGRQWRRGGGGRFRAGGRTL